MRVPAFGRADFTLPSFLTTVGENAFAGIAAESVYVPDSCAYLGDGAFRDCRALTRVVIGDGVTRIGDRAFQVMNMMPNQDALAGVTFGKGLLSVGAGAFYGRAALTSVRLPEGLLSIGDEAFCSCFGLSDLTLPDTLTSIGHWAFSGCRSLTALTVPAGVTDIGEDAFRGCSRSLTLTVTRGSVAEAYCAEHGIPYDLAE